MNTRRYQSVAVILLFLLFASGCGSDSKDDPKDKDGTAKATYASPQAVFDAATAAVDKGDWPAFFMCLEPASREKFTAMYAMTSAFDVAFAGQGGDEGKKQANEIKAVFAKHGITEKMLSDDSEPKGDPKDALADFIKPIKDHKAFVADMGKVNGDKLKKSMPFSDEAKLSDVKEDGDSAKGTITFKRGGEEKTDAIDFKRIDGSWGIELVDKR